MRQFGKGAWDLAVFLDQIQQVKRMGPLEDLLKKIPGMSKVMGKGVHFDVNEWKRMEAIIYSMTPEERHHPRMITGSRRQRIANGSGTTLRDVNRLLVDFAATQRRMGPDSA